ncbi:unnamed protein product [Phytophthora fragariaefolia]|uniref:Unnamed protein product n=1 Tax=Phytophthora fragariaefolia TaxID=1490495 RepID=A0A9W6Y002_9STRA|nr:unnamed protein product [Phytophthora fragariaefolia]
MNAWILISGGSSAVRRSFTAKLKWWLAHPINGIAPTRVPIYWFTEQLSPTMNVTACGGTSAGTGELTAGVPQPVEVIINNQISRAYSGDRKHRQDGVREGLCSAQSSTSTNRSENEQRPTTGSYRGSGNYTRNAACGQTRLAHPGNYQASRLVNQKLRVEGQIYGSRAPTGRLGATGGGGAEPEARGTDIRVELMALSACTVGAWALTADEQKQRLGEILQQRDCGEADFLVHRKITPKAEPQDTLWGTGRPWVEAHFHEMHYPAKDGTAIVQVSRRALRHDNGLLTRWTTHGLKIHCTGQVRHN